MKKNSKRKIKDYSKYDVEDKEYYGLLYKRGRARIDVKRMSKTLKIDKKMLKVMNQPRKTVYFIPAKIKRYDYSFNIFVDELWQLKIEWLTEFRHAMKSIKTPEQARDEVTTGYFLQTGILEHDELQTYGNWELMKRGSTYNFIIKSMVAQYIHQIASILEATTIKVISSYGFKGEDYNRSSLRSFISRADGYDITQFDNYNALDELYTVWNFLKHNSISLYNKTKDKFPHLIYNNATYKNGNLALNYLKIDSDYIVDILDRLKGFYAELCKKGFHEDIENSEWNYDDYFRKLVYSEIEPIRNPLGLPPTV